MWRKSSYSADNGCVEVSFGEKVQVRDSKLGDDSEILVYTRAEWQQILHEVRSGRRPGCVTLAGPSGFVWSGRTTDLFGELFEPRALTFTTHEWDAFVAGVKAGEFDAPHHLTNVERGPHDHLRTAHRGHE